MGKSWQQYIDEGDFASALGIAQGIGLQFAEYKNVSSAVLILDVAPN